MSRFFGWIRVGLIVALLGFALFITSLRFAANLATEYRDELQQSLSETLGFRLQFQSISARLNLLDPEIQVEDVLLFGITPQSADARIRSLSIRVDLFRSMIEQRLAVRSLTISGLEMVLKQQSDGRWLFAGRPLEAGEKSLINFGRVEQLALTDFAIRLIQGDQDWLVSAMNPSGLFLTQTGPRRVAKGTLDLMLDQSGAERPFQLQNLRFSAVFDDQPGRFLSSNFSAYAEVGDLPSNLVSAQLPAPFDEQVMNLALWVESRSGSGSVKGMAALKPPPETTIDQLLDIELEFDGGFDLMAEQVDITARLSKMDLGEVVFELPAFSMGVDWSSEVAQFALALPSIEISESTSTQLSQARLVSPSLRDALKSIHASLDLSAVMASARLNDFIETLRIQADLEDATLETDGVLPGFKGVRGFLDIGVREGDLSIDATSLSLHFPKLYPQPWVLDQVRGQLAYHFEDGTWRLGSGLLEATADSVRARGKLQMNITPDFGSRTWGLVIGAADFRLRDSLPFIPSTVPQSAIDWLDDAIVSGSGDTTGLIVHGSLDQRQPKEEKIYSIVIEANQTELEFDPDWPHLYQLEGGVHVSNQGIQAQDLQGVFFDAALGPASLIAESLSWDRGAERLLIDSPLSGSQGDLLNVLKETPVAASVNDFARQWQGGGALSGRLIIDVPLLEGLDPLLVDATVEMKDAHMVMPEFDLELTALDGMFRYATDGGLSAPSVSLRILGEPAQATIETEMVGAGGVTRINLGGEMVIAKLDDWLDLAILKFAEGRSRFEATLQIPFGGRVNQPSIELWSGLKGVTVSMPPPLAKISADSGRNLHLLQVFDDNGSEISFEIDDALTGVLKLEQNQVLGGLIQLGRPVAQAGTFDALRVVGQTAFVGAEEWIEFIEAFEEASQEVASTFRERLDELSISVDSLDFFGLEFERADLVVSATEEAWVFDVMDDEIRGRIQVNDSDTKRVEALIDYLALTSDDSGDPLLGLKSEDLVPMRLDLRSLTVDGEDYGAWSFDVVPADAAVLIENLSAKVKGMEVLSSEPLVWQMAVRDPTSHFKGTIAVPDVRASLEAWGFAAGLEGSDFLMQADFEWPGSPLNISETRLSGAFSMKGGKGKIVQADAASGALKLLGVFDFAEIAQRLSLDLANVLGEGHAFNEVGGSFNLTPGLIQTKDPVVISGPGSQLTFAGELAVPSEVIDYDLIVTLPLNKNLPWYAAYSAIATGPLVGAGVLLAQQVFKNQIDELTSLKYELTGTLEEPMVELVAVFDSSIRASTDEVMDASGTEATVERKSP
ncbi:MAG: DUF3971 domain-containing protein [Pseudomonadales bacterium]